MSVTSDSKVTRGILLLVASVVTAMMMVGIGENTFPGVVVGAASTGCFIWGLGQILGRHEKD